MLLLRDHTSKPLFYAKVYMQENLTQTSKLMSVPSVKKKKSLD